MTWSLGDFANSREIAAASLGALVLLILLLVRSTRPIVFNLVSALGNWKILVPLALYAAYLAGVVWLALTFGVWTWNLLGASLAWFAVSGLSLFGRGVTSAAKTEGFFRKHVQEMVKLAVLFEFFVNVQPLPLVGELILQPVLTLLVLSVGAGNLKDELRPLARISGFLLAIAALGLSVFTISALVQNPDKFPIDGLLRELFLPIWLGLAAVPFVYLVAMIAGYELMMLRLSWLRDGRRTPLRARLGLLSALGTDLRLIDKFVGQRGREVVKEGTFRGARREVATVRAQMEAERARRAAARQKLHDFAGVQGKGPDGRRLDRREFEATKRALDWLHACHAGRYRSAGRYAGNVLEVIGDFERQGLEGSHGIQMKVRRDGQAWYAVRQTVGGYYFAIGANGPPHSQWFYDGDRTPHGFPSAAGGWSDAMSETRSEWLPEEPV